MVEVIGNKNKQQQIRLNLGISWQSKTRTNQNRVKQKKMIIKYANINWFDAIKRKWTKKPNVILSLRKMPKMVTFCLLFPRLH